MRETDPSGYDKGMKNIYEKLLLAPLTDIVCSLPVLSRNRQKVIPGAEGVVLEPGIGSGLNLQYYDPQRVRHVIGVDPSGELLRLARTRAGEVPFPVEFLERSAEELSMEDASVDTVVLTFTGCSIPDVAQALAEFRRVLKPGGRLLFCEHGRSHEHRVARFQDLANPVWRSLAGGCHLNRDIEQLLREAGFNVERCDRFYAMPRPRFISYMYVGSAIPG